MKKLCLLSLSVFSLLSFAQIDHQKGDILSNELMNKDNTLLFPKKDINSYHRIYNTTSEVFLRVPQEFYYNYRITIAEQAQEKKGGIFRFFDLEPGRHQVAIYVNHIEVYRTVIYLYPHNRLVLDFNPYRGLYVVDRMSLPSDYKICYNKNDWSQWDNNHTGLNDKEFSDFLIRFKNENFDDDKVQLFSIQNKTTRFSSKQILELINTMSFDKNKLKIIKAAYEHCIDRHNFYKVSEGLTFSSSKKELSEYLAQKNP